MGAMDKECCNLLSDLPSKGFFSSSVISTNLGGSRVYVTDHDTSPPGNFRGVLKLIKTDQMNILIRSLVLKQQTKAGSSGKGVATKRGSRKRGSERAVDGRASTKRAASESQEEPRSHVPENLDTLTVERIRVFLRERGLSISGRKAELIARLRSALN
uniref:uncharacterized protein LOC122588310 n=1 Tax=Erigeron canadensis TaxID=72917 RepID=UPI001CB93FA3|nr:uncharacterized protein LOC122588310 [Erigeron canadensis]